MSDFPVYSQEQPKKPNPFFRFCGHPVWTVLTLIALFFYCALMTPIFDTFWVLYLFPFPLFFIFFVLCMVGAFGCRRYVLASVSILLFFAILVFSFQISDCYDSLRFRVLEGQMCETAEKIPAELPPFSGHESFWVSLPASKAYLSRGGRVYVEQIDPRATAVAFVFQSGGVLGDGSYYVYKRHLPYQSAGISFATVRRSLSENFCLAVG